MDLYQEMNANSDEADAGGLPRSYSITIALITFPFDYYRLVHFIIQ